MTIPNSVLRARGSPGHLDGSHDNRLRPFRHLSQRAAFLNHPESRTKNQTRLRRETQVRITLRAIVKDQEMRKYRQKPYEVVPAPFESFADLLVRDIVATLPYPGPHALDVKVRISKAHVPYRNRGAAQRCSLQETGNCVAAKGRLEIEREPLFDGPLEELAALVPREAVGLAAVKRRVRGLELTGGFVWIVERTTSLE